VANPRYRDVPGAMLRVGNLPGTGARAADQGTHTADDGILNAMGPGAEQFHGFMENTDVFRAIASSLGLGQRPASRPANPQVR
jgi:alkaline phosphatase